MTVADRAPLVVTDARDDVRVSGLAPVATGDVGSFLGVPLVSDDGQAVGALCVYGPGPRSWSARDVTTLEHLADSVVAELELAALSAEFETGQVVWRLATDAAEVGAFDLDLLNGELRWDDRLLELFGLDRATFSGSMESFNKAVHPEDLPRVLAALDTAVQTCGDYEAEYRILLPDGDLRWIAARGRALAGEDGRAARLLGAAFDTTASQESEARVARVLESMPTAFFSLDREWRFSYVNAEAERLLESRRDELVGRVIWEAFPGSVGTEFEASYRRAVEAFQPVAFDAYYPAPLAAWYEVRAWPNPDGLAVYFIDVTERHQAQEQVARAARRAALFADVTQQLSGTLDLGEAVRRLGELVVPTLADWCVATLVVDEGREGRPPIMQDVGGWHRDTARQATVDRYVATRLSALADGTVLPTLLASSRPLAINEGATEQLCALFSDDDVRRLVRELAPDCAAVVPLHGRDRLVGLLTVFGDADRGGFRDDDLDTLAEVATRAGLAVDNARLFAEQRDLAEALQRSMLTSPPQPDDLQIAVRYEAAAMTAQVGGDWYDAFVQPEGATVIVIGDMVGHDTAAAAAMGQVRSLLRGIAVHTGSGPANLLYGVDRALATLGVETTATAVVARLEQTTGEVEAQVTRVRWSNAGHPPPVVIDETGAVHVLDAEEPDLLLGLDPSTERTEHVLTVERGATVLLYTDGLVERRGEDLEIGLERLRAELERLVVTTPDLDRLCDRLLARMVPSRREDDIALVAVRLHPQREEGRRATDGPAGGSPIGRNRLVRAQFAADPASVPGIRRFVRDALTPRPDGSLADDAELCVSELAGNAALHSGSTFLEVAVRAGRRRGHGHGDRRGVGPGRGRPPPTRRARGREHRRPRRRGDHRPRAGHRRDAGDRVGRRAHADRQVRVGPAHRRRGRPPGPAPRSRPRPRGAGPGAGRRRAARRLGTRVPPGLPGRAQPAPGRAPRRAHPGAAAACHRPVGAGGHGGPRAARGSGARPPHGPPYGAGGRRGRARDRRHRHGGAARPARPSCGWRSSWPRPTGCASGSSCSPSPRPPICGSCARGWRTRSPASWPRTPRRPLGPTGRRVPRVDQREG